MAASILWVFVDGLGLTAPEVAAAPSPGLDARLGGPALVDLPLPLGGPCRRFALDAARAKLHLGWEPWTALVDGAGATVSWWTSRVA